MSKLGFVGHLPLVHMPRVFSLGQRTSVLISGDRYWMLADQLPNLTILH